MAMQCGICNIRKKIKYWVSVYTCFLTYSFHFSYTFILILNNIRLGEHPHTRPLASLENHTEETLEQSGSLWTRRTLVSTSMSLITERYQA